jgi:hypothetical protein
MATIGVCSFECSDAAPLARVPVPGDGTLVDSGASAAYATAFSMPSARPGCLFALPARRGHQRDAERTERLGAERVGDNEQDGARWTVFRDPTGGGCSRRAQKANHTTPLPQERKPVCRATQK